MGWFWWVLVTMERWQRIMKMIELDPAWSNSFDFRRAKFMTALMRIDEDWRRDAAGACCCLLVVAGACWFQSVRICADLCGCWISLQKCLQSTAKILRHTGPNKAGNCKVILPHIRITTLFFSLKKRYYSLCVIDSPFYYNEPVENSYEKNSISYWLRM